MFIALTLNTHSLHIVPSSELEASAKSPWYLFNDFLVKNIDAEEVFSFKGSWKVRIYKKHSFLGHFMYYNTLFVIRFLLFFNIPGLI